MELQSYSGYCVCVVVPPKGLKSEMFIYILEEM